ncbi:hypothetical protein KHV-MN_00032 [Cyprinid herpesvirus 3]|uniref:ORF25R n=1 Tax=Cyprinid herpesvirus 3 TaxID=180230 RepID=H9U398_CYHV3|nr:putative membrane glycoprotein [Cyprinid herpesvirus 3]AIC32380.1 ORF25R [Cyprinid herpesvirus 3]AOO32432.1 membrane protein ORF25 [Cyprinid herpesvirus 3]AVL27960.1 membrane protein ORF25 [Cyprinid herpesvirus 3]QQZ02111.1 hypothetical protein KHV-MN_00032 [Cyprinid herpesvirus 3]
MTGCGVWWTTGLALLVIAVSPSQQTTALNINSLVYSVSYSVPRFCGVNGLPYEISATFTFDKYNVSSVEWLAPVTPLPSTPGSRTNVTWALGRPHRTTLSFRPFVFTDATRPYAVRAMGEIIDVGLIKRYDDLPLGSVKAALLRVQAVGFDPVTSYAILKCVPSCSIRQDLRFVWFNYDQVQPGVSGDTLTTTVQGRYMCGVAGSQLFSKPIWVGEPVFDCPFDVRAWCPSGTVQKYENEYPRRYTEDDLRQPGTVLACNETKAVSTLGMCAERTVCNVEATNQCSDFSPAVYTSCNNTAVHKFCPDSLPFVWTSSTPWVVSTVDSNNIVFTDVPGTTSVINTFCGAETNVYLLCGTPEQAVSAARPRPVFSIPTLDTMTVANGDGVVPELSVVREGTVFEMECPSPNLVVYWRRGNLRMAVSLGSSNVRILRKTLTREDLNATWSCVGFDSYNAITATLFRSVYLTDVKPTTPAPATSTTTTPTLPVTTPKTTTLRTTTLPAPPTITTTTPGSSTGAGTSQGPSTALPTTFTTPTLTVAPDEGSSGALVVLIVITVFEALIIVFVIVVCGCYYYKHNPELRHAVEEFTRKAKEDIKRFGAQVSRRP